MIPNLPDGPFSYMTTAPEGAHEGTRHVYIVDASGRKIASLWGPADVKLAMAALIIEARSLQLTDTICAPTKIEAIREYRQRTGALLKEALQWT